MIVKGLIKSINFADNSCRVRIPLFETAASKGEVVLNATMLIQPGMYNGYIEGDVVFIDFENDDLGQPIVLGKLYLGAAKEAATTVHSALAVSNLTVTSNATLPMDTRIVLDEAGSAVPVDNGITSYKSLSDIIKALYKTETSANQIVKEQSDMIASIKVEYLSQPVQSPPPEAGDPAWQVATPTYRDEYAIWQKTTCYNKRGQILSTEIICLTAVSSSASYRLRCSSKIHAASNQTEPVVITAMVKLGNSLEIEDTSATIVYKWSGSDTETEAGSNLVLTAGNLEENNLILTLKHGENTYDTDTIMYAPLNTPILVLSSDTDSITYAADGSIILSDPVTSTATLYLNGNAFADDAVTYHWELTNCAEELVYDPNFAEPFYSTNNTVTIKSISSLTRSGTAVCTATVQQEGAFKGKSYTKTFGVTQTRVGENATSYWLSSTCTVHMGQKHGEAIVITARKQTGISPEEIDKEAYIWYKYASEEHWSLAAEEVVEQTIEIVDGESITKDLIKTVNYKLMLPDPQDKDLIILATHEHELIFNPNDYNEVDLLLDPNVYEREEIPFSPLNTPVINLTNDMAAFACKSDGSKLNPDDTVATTAALWLNGVQVTEDVTYSWTLVDCATPEGNSTITGPDLIVKDIDETVNTASALCTAQYKNEEYSKTFIIAKQLQGRSPYVIDIYNDFVSLPATEEGEIPEAFKDDIVSLTTHTLSCYYGDEPITITEYVESLQVDDEADTAYRVKYTATNNITLKETLQGPDFAITAMAADASVGSIKYELYKGTSKLATAKFEVSKQVQGVSATSYWIDYTARVHRGVNQQDSIKATAWKQFGNKPSELDSRKYIRYGWRQSDGTFDSTQFSVPVVGECEVFSSTFVNADLLFELGLYDEGTEEFTVVDSEVITYSPADTPVLDLSNDRATLTYTPTGKKIGTDTVSSTATLYLDGQPLTENVSYEWDDINKTTDATLTITELMSNTVEFKCTATLNDQKLFKNPVTVSKVFTVSKQIQGENSISYWLKLSSRVHLGVNQQEDLVITAMRKVGSEELEDEDEGAKLYYRYYGTTSWLPTETDDATHKLVFKCKDENGNPLLQDKDLIIKAKHLVVVDGNEQEQEYETETLTYSPLNTPALDLSNDTDTILYPAKSIDDSKGPLGEPVESEASLYLNGDVFAASDVNYSWIFADCTGTYETSKATVTEIAVNKTTGRAICTAKVLTEGPFKNKTYTKTFTVSKTRKGDNAIVYSIVSDHPSIKLDPNTNQLDITNTAGESILTGTCYTHDGSSIQPFGGAEYRYKIDTKAEATGYADNSGKFSIDVKDIKAQVEISLVVDGSTVDKEVVKIVKDGLLGVSIASQTTYYALVRYDFKQGENQLSAPLLIYEDRDNNGENEYHEDLTVRNQAGTALATSGNNRETIGDWSPIPPEHDSGTIATGWKYWTTIKTVYSNGTITFTSPIINEDLSGVYELAQGKTTNYYSALEPTANQNLALQTTKYVYKPNLKVDDCWFDLGYYEIDPDEQATLDIASKYMNYYIKVDGEYIRVTAKNFTELAKNNINAPNTIAYVTGGLKQCTLLEDGKATWADIGNEIVANKLTANYINALDITAKKINVPNLFTADSLATDPYVQIAGFNVEQNTLTTGTNEAGNLIKLNSDSTNQYSFSALTPEVINDGTTIIGYNSSTGSIVKAFQRSKNLWQYENNCYIAFATDNSELTSDVMVTSYAITKITFNQVPTNDFTFYIRSTSTTPSSDYVIISKLNASKIPTSTATASSAYRHTYTTNNNLTGVTFAKADFEGKINPYFYIVYRHGSSSKGTTDKGQVYLPVDIRMSIGDNFQVLADGSVYANNLFLGGIDKESGDSSPDANSGLNYDAKQFVTDEISGALTAERAEIETLIADSIQAERAEIETVIADSIQAESADIKDLMAEQIEAVAIEAKKIEVRDGTNGTGNILLKVDGTATTATNRVQIGGFKVTNNKLYAGSGTNYVALGTEAILLGGNSTTTAPFSVTKAGALKADSGEIAGLQLSKESLQLYTDGPIQNASITTKSIQSGNFLELNLKQELGISDDQQLILLSAVLTNGSVSGMQYQLLEIDNNISNPKATIFYVSYSSYSLGYSANIALKYFIRSPSKTSIQMQRLASEDNTFICRTNAATGSNLTLDRFTYDNSIGKTAYINECTVGPLTIKNGIIGCKEAGIQFIDTGHMGENDYTATISILSPDIISVDIAGNDSGNYYNTIGTKSFMMYDAKFPIKYRLSGASDFIYDSILVSAGCTFGRLKVEYQQTVVEAYLLDWSDWDPVSTFNFSARALDPGSKNKRTQDWDTAIAIRDANLIPVSSEGFEINYEANKGQLAKCPGGSLGDYDRRWYNIYSHRGNFTGDVDFYGTVYQNDSSIHSSDKNIKNTVQSLSDDLRYEKLFDNLRPVSYKFNEGTSDRLHTGLIAQELKQSILDAGLTTTEMAAYCEWETSDRKTKETKTTCGIRYEELISLNIHEIQKLKKRVAQQDQIIADLTQRLEKLESKN
jgi:hypothetical protein